MADRSRRAALGTAGALTAASFTASHAHAEDQTGIGVTLKKR